MATTSTQTRRLVGSYSCFRPFKATHARQPMTTTLCQATRPGSIQHSRRAVLSGVVGVCISVRNAKAAEVWQTADASKQRLPQNYVKFARRLLDALRDSIEVDLSSANESEVRRKADPAKGLVKEWVSNWRDARPVSSDASHRQITESLQLLGDFYLKKGQRTRLPQELGSEILRHLDAASAALPV